MGIIGLCEAALSLPTDKMLVTKEFIDGQHAIGFRDAHLTIINQGKVVVDREKLREIEWEPFTHTAVSCPVCKLVFVHTDKQRHHMPDCWLGALLKDAP